MGIPWFPFVTTRNISALKWVDWCLSVGTTFTPVPLPPLIPAKFNRFAVMFCFLRRLARSALLQSVAPMVVMPSRVRVASSRPMLDQATNTGRSINYCFQRVREDGLWLKDKTMCSAYLAMPARNRLNQFT